MKSMNVHEFPCMYCGRITRQGCPKCGAACCRNCGPGLCPLCIRIQALQTEQAMLKQGMIWKHFEMECSAYCTSGLTGYARSGKLTRCVAADPICNQCCFLTQRSLWRSSCDTGGGLPGADRHGFERLALLTFVCLRDERRGLALSKLLLGVRQAQIK